MADDNCLLVNKASHHLLQHRLGCDNYSKKSKESGRYEEAIDILQRSPSFTTSMLSFFGVVKTLDDQDENSDGELDREIDLWVEKGVLWRLA